MPGERDLPHILSVVLTRALKFDMGNLDYKMSIQPGYVLVERPRDYDVVMTRPPEMLTDLSAFCKSAACRKVLILGPDTKVKLSKSDIVDLGAEIAKLNLQIAVAESHDASDEEVNLLENEAGERGGSIRFFNSEPAAKDWLRIP